MAIRFSCPSCFKVHSAPDRLAGLTGRCGRCGYGFTTPGVPVPSAPSAFVPVAAPDPYASGGQNPPSRGAAGWGGAFQAVTLGLILAILLVGFTWHFRDTLVTAHPGLGAFLPPAVAKVRPAPPQVVVVPAQAPVAQVAAAPPVAPPINQGGNAPDQGGWTFAGFAFTYERLVAVAVGLVLLVLLPLLIPPILSRRNYLSVGRWLIFAGLSFFIFGVAVLGATYETASVATRAAAGLPQAWFYPCSLLISPAFWSVIGCTIAAGISPKMSGP